MDSDTRLEERIERLMETLAMTQDRLVEIQAETTESLQRIEGLLKQILAAVARD